jgi:steroid 5-alpha reductase family enzyme
MLVLDPPYALWSIWKELSYLYRIFVLILIAVSMYSAFLAVSTTLRLRSMGRLHPTGDIASFRESVAALDRRWANLQQVLGATFYLFGFLLFLGLQTIANYLADGTGSGVHYVVENVILHCAFAANIFFVFLALHCVQWFARARVRSYSERVGAHQTALLGPSEK